MKVYELKKYLENCWSNAEVHLNLFFKDSSSLSTPLEKIQEVTNVSSETEEITTYLIGTYNPLTKEIK